MIPDDFTVRASSLSQYPDCPRRWAARHLRPMILALGYSLRTLPASIGAAIGSGTHKAVSVDLEAKLETGELGAWSTVEEAGVQELQDRIADEGVLWDEVSPTLSDAQLQVRRLAKTYRRDVGERIEPVAIERRLKARHKTGVVLSGQQDILVSNPLTLMDLKTGKFKSDHSAQMGAYALLLRSHGFLISAIEEHYLARVSLKKEQPPVSVSSYDIVASEAQASGILRRIHADVSAFTKDGDREVFLANPSSRLCGEKHCPAAGTAWCNFGRAK